MIATFFPRENDAGWWFVPDCWSQSLPTVLAYRPRPRQGALFFPFLSRAVAARCLLYPRPRQGSTALARRSPFCSRVPRASSSKQTPSPLLQTNLADGIDTDELQPCRQCSAAGVRCARGVLDRESILLLNSFATN